MHVKRIEKGYVTTHSGQIHYRRAGDANAPALVLLHQTASSSAMYDALMAELCDRYNLIAPDMLGFGQSDPAQNNETSIPQHANLFWQLLDQLEIETCAIFGHHTGASVAVQMTHDRPAHVTKLALSGPPLLTAEQISKLRQTLLPIKLDEAGDFLLDTWKRLRQKESQVPLELTLRETLLTITAADHYPAAYRAVFDHPMGEQLSQLRCPTLLFAGTKDSLYASLEPTAACLPPDLPRTVHHIPDSGSYICDEQPKLVGDILHQFLIDKTFAL